MKLRTVVGLGLAIVWGGCVQILDADYEYKPQCTSEAECDDKNPCTTDACSAEQACEHSPVADGPLAQQVAGDCRRDDCLSGEVVPTNDDADIADDNESCTTDSCNAGNPLHTAVVDGEACTIGMSGGQCLTGVCVVDCSATKPCDDMNPCTTDTCTEATGACTFTPLDGMPTPGFQEPVGDCKVHVCQQGVDTAVNDDADIPDDMNSCTENICMNGVGSNPGVPSGTPCIMGQPAVCDGLGTCVECNVPGDCVALPADDDCQTRTCVNNVCGQSFTAMGTPISAQTMGDCQQTVCNGTGGTVIENLDTDVPDDNNACTMNICTNGVPSNPNETLGASCGTPLVCDGMGNCVGCNVPSDCVDLPADDFCKTRTCVNSVCGLSLTPAGTDLPTGQTAQDCIVLECDATGNIVATADVNDKPVDGNQCTQDVCSMQGVPSNPFEPVNTACSQNGGTLCNGAGACKKASGAVCAAPGDCLSGFCADGVCCDSACGVACQSCNVAGNVGKCINVVKGAEDLPGCTGSNSCDGSGACKKDDAQGCATASECVSNFCIDGVCCSSACTTACRACNVMGSVGVCTPLTSGEDNVPANICNGTKGCDASGSCKLDNGQTCATGSDCISGQCFDGVCCNVACSGTCKSCNITGAVGTCSNVATGQDDANGVPACSGANQSCDGMGVCKKEIAQACAANAECLSGFCADGVCCNSGCATTCQACNLAGTIGTCTNVLAGQDDVGTCSGSTQSCDGAGACKSEIGVVCSINANCLTNFCVDGFCCNTACTGTCQACSALVQGQGTNGTCGPIIAGSDPSNECVNGACNGASTCKLDNGAACTMASQCLSGFCADGVCCNSACGNSDATDCQACTTAGGAMANGTCSTVSAGKVCRAAGGGCDVTETCNGVSTVCPADAVLPLGTVCRAALPGGCDVAESCNGALKVCPADTFTPAGTVCRASIDACDVAETCTGVSGLCPSDMFQPVTTVCRPALGACDVEESCTGMSPACPPDAVTPAGTVCRVAMSFCDVDEVCDGMALDCPVDAFAANGTVCSPQSCMGSTQSNADTCDGLGMCLDGGTTSCGAYTCGGTSCKVSCMNDIDCTAGFFCQGTMCK